MNPDAPRTAREELEIRITALLMGQLPQDEAAELLRQIAADPELTALYNQMRHAVELLREARSLPEQAAPEIPLQLSKERRAVLLAKFRGLKPMPPLKSVPTPGFSPSPRTILAPPKKKRDWKWVVPVGIAASFLVVVGGAVFFPMASRTRSQVVTREADDFVGEESILSLTAEPSFSLFSWREKQEDLSRSRSAEPTRRSSGATDSRPAGSSGKDALASGWASKPGAVQTFDSTTDTKAYALYAGASDGRKLAAAAAPAPRRDSVLYLPKAAPETAPTSESLLADVSGRVVDTLQIAENAPAAVPMESKPADAGIVQDAAKSLANSVEPALNGNFFREKGKTAAVTSGEEVPLTGSAPANVATTPAPVALTRATDGTEGVASKAEPQAPSRPVVALSDQSGQPADAKGIDSALGNVRFSLRERAAGEKSEVAAASGPGEPAVIGKPMTKSKELAELAKSQTELRTDVSKADRLADHQHLEQNYLDSPQALTTPRAPAKPSLAASTPAKPVGAVDRMARLAVPPPSVPSSAPASGIVSDPAPATPASPAVAGLGLAPLKEESFKNGVAAAEDFVAANTDRGVQPAEQELQRRMQPRPAAGGEIEKGRKGFAEVDSDADVVNFGDTEKLAKTPESDVKPGTRYIRGGQQSEAAAARGDEVREAMKQTISRGRIDLAGKAAEVNREGEAVEQKQKENVKGEADFGGLAYDSTRSSAMWEVSEEWQRPFRRLDSKADEKTVEEDERYAHSAPLSTAGRVNLGTELKSELSAGQTDKFWAYKNGGTAPTAGKSAGVNITGGIVDGISKTGSGALELGVVAGIDGKTTATAADGAVFWDIPAGGDAKAGQQWFGRANGGFAGGAGGGAARHFFTSGGTRGNSPEMNRADTLGRMDGAALGGALNVTGLKREEVRDAKATDKAGANAPETTLELAPQAVEFEGFINYGAPIQTTGVDANGREFQNVVTSSFVANPQPKNEKARGEEDAVSQLRGMSLAIPAPGASASPKAERLEELAAIKLPSLAAAKDGEGAKVAEAKAAVVTEKLEKRLAEPEPPAPPQKPEPPVPQPEVSTKENAFSTFSLNVSDVSFKLAQASLEKGAMPDVASVRTEEFINALDYRDPEPAAGAPLAFASERARYPFAHNRDLLRLSVKTAAAGRQSGRPLNLTLLLDNSGSMERADRVRILEEALRVLAKQLQPQDKLSIITFSRTPRLWCDGVEGNRAAEFTGRVAEIRPEGGTDLGAAMDLGYKTALKHYQVGSVNRVVLLTDGAANLGNVNPDTLRKTVENHRKQGVAFDCFGVGWEEYNDTLLEQLSRNGDGRYGFINSPEAAATEFAGALAGALRVAASDVKVQVEFNPRRVTSYRQLGYAKHQLKKEQFRDNTVDAAEIGAAESGNALYTVEVNPNGVGEIATVRVRFKVPGTSDYREQEWTVPFTAPAPALEQGSSSLKLAATAAAFAEMLAQSPFAAEVSPHRLLGMINGIPAIYGADPRPGKLEWMIRQAKSISGR